MYFTSLEKKDHSSDVIECIYDDVMKDKFIKKELFLFLKETKMKNKVDIINKKKLLAEKTQHLSMIQQFKQRLKFLWLNHYLGKIGLSIKKSKTITSTVQA